MPASGAGERSSAPPVGAAEVAATASPWAIAALSFAAFASAASMRVCDAMLPAFSARYDIGLAQASQVVTAFAVAYGLLQAFFGPLGDRFGKYRVVAWACAASAVSALGCALAPGFGALVAARFVAGGTAAAVIPLAMAWLGDTVPYERRQPVLARFLTGQILGLATGPFAGGFAADHLGPRAPFVALAAWFAVAAVLLLWMERTLRGAGRAEPGGGATPGGSSALAGFAYVLGERWARVVVAVVFLEGIVLFGPFAFIATHLHRTLGLSLSAAGGTLLLYAGGGLAFAALSHLLVRRLGESGLAAAGGAVLCAALLTVAFAPAWPVAMVGTFNAGLGFYMLHNTLQTNATQMAPARRGAAVSLFACCFFLGQATGAALAGIAVDRVGTTPVIVAGALALAALGLWFGRRLAARRHDRGAPPGEGALPLTARRRP